MPVCGTCRLPGRGGSAARESVSVEFYRRAARPTANRTKTDRDYFGAANRYPCMSRLRLAPEVPSHEPVVRVYAARCRSVLGLLGVHTWIATKRRGASAFTVYEVTGGRLRVRAPVLSIRRRVPGLPWFGNAAERLCEKRGDAADALISRIEDAVRDYPYSSEYRAWPGPNSNTFTAYVARAVPELEVNLPPTAIGKDYLGGRLAAAAPSGHGFQLSLFGLLGVLASRIEGIEINVLGISFGIDPLSPALRLPFLGRIGAARVGSFRDAQHELAEVLARFHGAVRVGRLRERVDAVDQRHDAARGEVR